MVDLGQFIEKLKDAFKSGATAMMYSPGRAFFARFDGSRLNVFDQERDLVSSAYEIRVFDATRELRWLSDGSFAELSDEVFKDCEKIDQTYLLWGEPTGESKDGWTPLGSAQIGEFRIPVKAVKRVALDAVEYIEKEGKFGNSFVANERLTGLREVK